MKVGEEIKELFASKQVAYEGYQRLSNEFRHKIDDVLIDINNILKEVARAVKAPVQLYLAVGTLSDLIRNNFHELPVVPVTVTMGGRSRVLNVDLNRLNDPAHTQELILEAKTHTLQIDLERAQKQLKSSQLCLESAQQRFDETQNAVNQLLAQAGNIIP